MRLFSWLLATSALLAACSEETTPIGLDPTTTVVGADPNAEVRAEAQGYADQQCLDDPELAEGVLEIVDPDTEEIVGRITANCASVRSGG